MNNQPSGSDRYSEATYDIAEQIGDKIMSLIRHPSTQAKIQSVLDPVVSNIISRVFPYILFSAILFLILFILTLFNYLK